MIIKYAKRSLSRTTLIDQNKFYLLDHSYMQKIKEKMFGEQQQTLWLKTKFFLKQAKYTFVQGFKDLYSDTKWIVNIHRKKKRQQLTGYQLSVNRRITIDLLKFIPYSVILIVPFAEFMLPVLLWLFPNAVPSPFLFDTAAAKRLQIVQHEQEQSHDILVQKLMNVLIQEYKKEQEFNYYDTFKKDFFEVIDDLNVKLNYENFSCEELIHVLKFMGGNYVTGTATLNKIVNLFTMNIPRVTYKIFRYLYYKIKKQTPPPYQDPFFVNGDFKLLQFNYFPFKIIKKQFLLYQIRSNFKTITEEDLAIEKYGMNQITGYQVMSFARQRGLAAISCYDTLKNVLSNDWVKITTHPKFTDNTKLWYSVMMYHFMKRANKDLN